MNVFNSSDHLVLEESVENVSYISMQILEGVFCPFHMKSQMGRKLFRLVVNVYRTI